MDPKIGVWIRLGPLATIHEKSCPLGHLSYCGTSLAAFCLFDLILYVPSTIFQLNRDGSSWVEPVLSQDQCVLLKDHNAVMPVGLEPAALRSRVKHSTTEPLGSISRVIIQSVISVSARPEFLGVIDDPLFENLGVIGKFRGSELFLCIKTFYLSAHSSILKVFEECPLS